MWLVGWWLYPHTVSAEKVAGVEAFVTIHFDSGKAALGAGNKDRLRKFLSKYEIGPESRVFIVGYTDSVGDKARNYQLSRDRAQAIRRQILSGFGLDATVVMAIGKGEASPVADNRSISGRAANRRVEIYLVNTRVRKPNRVYGAEDPYLKDIQALVQEAQSLIKQRQLGEAIKILKKARGLGGDHYADWHAAYGIAGFYANAPAAEIHAHFATALQLDPYNDIARDYMSRVTARQNVDRGRVNRHMGQTAEDAISVTAVVQQHEYLRLFKVVPVARRKVDGLPVDGWECLDEQGQPVTYYFDHSKVYGWAFAEPSATGKMGAAPKHPLKQVAHEAALSVSPPAAIPAQSGSAKPKGVWNSKVFK
jgi:hypothetical protein